MCLFCSGGNIVLALARPVRLYLPHTLGYQFAVTPMRPAMHGQAKALRRDFPAREQQAILAKVFEPRPMIADFAEHARQAVIGQQLPWQEMVSLERWIVARTIPAIDAAKRQEGP